MYVTYCAFGAQRVSLVPPSRSFETYLSSADYDFVTAFSMNLNWSDNLASLIPVPFHFPATVEDWLGSVVLRHVNRGSVRERSGKDRLQMPEVQLRIVM